jgi:hypothetical protein
MRRSKELRDTLGLRRNGRLTFLLPACPLTDV